MKIGYQRTSTSEQDLDSQKAQLEEAGCDRIFSDHGISGTAKNRPGLEEALAYARKGDVLTVVRLDRLARSVRQLLDTVEQIEAKGVELCSLHEQMDTSSPSGRFVFNVFAAIGQFERELISQRTKEGLAAARKAGRVGGRPRALNEADLRQARAMLRDEAISMRQVAKRFNVSVATLYRHLGARSAFQGVVGDAH